MLHLESSNIIGTKTLVETRNMIEHWFMHLITCASEGVLQ